MRWSEWSDLSLVGVGMSNVQVTFAVRQALILPEDARRGTMADRAGHHHDVHVASRLASMTTGEIAMAIRYKARLKAGVAHICEDCNILIGEARRRYQPDATRCVVCQERQEK